MIWQLLNAGSRHYIGYDNYDPSYFGGYLSELHWIDNAVVGPTNFGEYDDNGVWRPIEVTGLTYGTNGFYLKFDPSATNGIGHDHSGNGNHWTPTGFDTTNTTASTYDVMSDTPTTNWATLNPLKMNSSVVTASEGNLVATFPSGSAGSIAMSTLAVTSGKWYWEVTVGGTDGSTQPKIGVLPASTYTERTTSIDVSDFGYSYSRNGTKWITGTNSSYGATFTTNDVIGMALDMDAGTLVAYKNGTSQGTLATGISGEMAAGITAYNGYSQTVNFGQRAFAYTPPTGFKALNTSNLPAPDIADGSKNFDTKLYQGNEGDVSAPATQTITGLDFAPDFVWIKCRNSGTANHSLFDQVRGTGKTLWSNSTSNEQTNYTRGYLSAFTSDGFTVRAGSTDARDVNGLGSTGLPPTEYVAWNWLAGNGTSSNTDGSITSTVSANPTAGFSIVSYTGTTAAATVGHGLGVPPSLVLVKTRSQAGNWQGYHAALGKDYTIKLNTTDAQENISNYWGSGGVTSTVVGLIGGGYGNNVNGATHIAYCFAEVEGYSKFGSYTGNGSTDGPFVYCGFKPSFVLFKSTASSTNWTIIDSARSTYNPAEAYLKPNATQIETNLLDIDMLSNGFKLRGTSGGDHNQSGTTFIFAAFASSPFGGSGVSPATAR